MENLTTSYHDSEVSDLIMIWLLINADIEGNEDHLLGELFTDFLGETDIIRLENYLSEYYDTVIDLPKDLKLISK